jgi:hypothetical protein
MAASLVFCPADGCWLKADGCFHKFNADGFWNNSHPLSANCFQPVKILIRSRLCSRLHAK